MPVFHRAVLRSVRILCSRLLESAEDSIRNIGCWNCSHIPPPRVRRAFPDTADARSVYHDSPTLPSRDLCTFLPDRTGRGCLPPRPLRRKLKIHRVSHLPGASDMAWKRGKHHYLHQRILVLRRIRHEVRARHTAEKAAWVEAIWTNADHLHHGVPDLSYTRYVEILDSLENVLIALVAIFSILQYTTSIPSMDSNVLTLVAIFLPLSSIWASSSGTGRTQAIVESDQQPNYYNSFTGSARPLVDYKNPKAPSSPTNTATTRISSSLPSPAHPTQQDMYLDLEAQGLEERQERTMSGAVAF